jgi:hypothetical protein
MAIRNFVRVFAWKRAIAKGAANIPKSIYPENHKQK